MKMAKASERPNLPWEFHVVNDASVNAFALPGGFIYVTRGLLTSINDEAELATVMGHEIGHVTNRHSVQQISKAQLAQLGLGLGSILSSDIARIAGLASQGLSSCSSSTAGRGEPGRRARRRTRPWRRRGLFTARRCGFSWRDGWNWLRLLEKKRMGTTTYQGISIWGHTPVGLDRRHQLPAVRQHPAQRPPRRDTRARETRGAVR